MSPLSQQQRDLLDQGYNIMLWNRDESLGNADVFEHDGERLIVVGHGMPTINGETLQRLTVRRAPCVQTYIAQIEKLNGGVEL
jgi:hypothetical protein